MHREMRRHAAPPSDSAMTSSRNSITSPRAGATCLQAKANRSRRPPRMCSSQSVTSTMPDPIFAPRTRRPFMHRPILAALAATLLAAPLAAQQPRFETTTIADGVYQFRWQGHNAFFVVTDAGVVAVDPISLEAAATYAAEIKRVARSEERRVGKECRSGWAAYK